MADIFIGYARLDRETIEKLASAIEASGYSVWWDRQIIAGSEFSRDIERELDSAKAVIIAWSQHANASPWVKDEAAVARDQSKLVPVSLDREPPPMGFRQYQAIDFSHWKGQTDSPALDDLLRAVEARIRGVEPGPPTAAPPSTRRKPTKNLGLAASLALLALIAGFAVFQAARESFEPNQLTSNASSSTGPAEQASPIAGSEPRVAVAPIKVRGDDPELANLAAALSEDIASGLSRFSYMLVATQPADLNATEPQRVTCWRGRCENPAPPCD